MQRRRYLMAIGTAGILATAGCLDDGNDGDSGDGDNESLDSHTDEDDSTRDTETATQEDKDEFTRSPVSTVEQYYHLAVEAQSPVSVEEFIDTSEEMMALFHSQSPFRQRLERRSASPPEPSELPDNNVTIETLETRVAYENLDETALREGYPELAEQEDTPNSLNPIAAAAEDNVIVEATTDASVAAAVGLRVTDHWIVTIENGEWHIIN